MKKEELKEYARLNSIFNSECKRVCSVMCKYEVFNHDWENNPATADCFEVNSNYEYIDWKGEDRYGDKTYGDFPFEYLLMTDEELTTACQKADEKYLYECERRKMEMKEAEENRKYQQYLELKKKFEGNE